MAISNYPSGFSNGLLLRGIPVTTPHPGKAFYVGDGDTAGSSPSLQGRATPSNGNTGTFLAPFKTLTQAVESCSAERGDVIYLLPGYNEAVESATEIEIDVENITIIGQGEGADQASLTYDTETAEVEVSGNGVVISGVNFICTDTSEATPSALSISGDDVKIDGNRFTTGNAATQEWVTTIDIEAASRTQITNNKLKYDDGVAGAVDFVSLSGVCIDTVIDNNQVVGVFSKGMVRMETTASQNTRVTESFFVNGGHDGLEAVGLIDDEVATTSGSGYVAGNRVFANVAHDAMVSTVGTETYFLGDDNVVAATAGTVGTDGAGSSFIKCFVATEIETDGDDAIASVESGTVAIWGIMSVQQATGGTTDKWNVNTEGGSILQVGVDGSVETAGDVTYATETPGGNQTHIEVAANLSANWIWDYPIYITGNDEIDVEGAEAQGAGGDCNYVIAYTPVSTGAVIAAAEA